MESGRGGMGQAGRGSSGRVGPRADEGAVPCRPAPPLRLLFPAHDFEPRNDPIPALYMHHICLLVLLLYCPKHANGCSNQCEHCPLKSFSSNIYDSAFSQKYTSVEYQLMSLYINHFKVFEYPNVIITVTPMNKTTTKKVHLRG